MFSFDLSSFFANFWKDIPFSFSISSLFPKIQIRLFISFYDIHVSFLLSLLLLILVYGLMFHSIFFFLLSDLLMFVLLHPGLGCLTQTNLWHRNMVRRVLYFGIISLIGFLVRVPGFHVSNVSNMAWHRFEFLYFPFFCSILKIL